MSDPQRPCDVCGRQPGECICPGCGREVCGDCLAHGICRICADVPAPSPNVVLIMSDQHHAGVMGCAGDPVADTPALDRLAREGRRFSHAYCPYPLCGPSRMAFMTARHPATIDCLTNLSCLSSDIPTYAHGFLAAGYETVLAGRMHFVGPDQRHGFARRLLSDVSPTAYLKNGWRLEEVLGDLIDTPGQDVRGVVKSGPGHTGYHAYDRAIAGATVDWLQERPADTDPFLLVVGLVSPHCPFVAPPEDFAFFADRIGPQDLPAAEAEQHPFMAKLRDRRGVAALPPVDAQWRTRVAYYGLCRFLDRQVGRILDALENTRRAANTIVVYTSDHGDMLGEHGTWWKDVLYEGSVRVPLIVRAPGRVPPATVDPANVSLIDIGPTLLDMVDADPMPAVDGRSFRCRWDGDADAWDDTAIAELVNGGEAQRMIRRGPWKYIYHERSDDELYNLDDDPGETENRAADPACADIVATLRERALADWDPATVRAKREYEGAVQPLLRQGVVRAPMPEPDTPWFTDPLTNTVDTLRTPPE